MVEGKKISELNAVDNLNYGSCFPVLINGATKKITFSNLLNDIISNLGNLNKEEISELQKKIKEHESRIEVNEKDIVIIEKTISDLQQKDTEQDNTITKYILLFEEMKNIYEQAVISGDIVDSELNVNSVNAIQNKAVAKLIPAQTSEENQLADKNFVNSSIQTETANFRGNWETFDDIPTDAENYPADYVGNKKPNVNDYLVVRDYNGEGTWRFKYIGKWEEVGKNGWKEEYQVNEKPFTSEQLASINSGITKQKVARYDGMTFPVGTILSGLYAAAPTGFLLCNGQEVAIADYFELYTVIGSLAECQSKNEGMFKVPDLRGKFLEGANGNLGTVKEAGLPNITGSFFVFTRDNYSSGAAMKDANGAFYLSTKNGICGNGGESNLSAGSNTCNIDASRSNSIYGKSDTVQPPAVCVNYIIKY